MSERGKKYFQTIREEDKTDEKLRCQVSVKSMC